MKKIISFFLSFAVFMCSSILNVSATENNIELQSKGIQKSEIMKALNLTSEKYGGKIVSVENYDSSKNVLDFDTLEDFKNSIGLIRFGEPTYSLETITYSDVNTNLIYEERVCTATHPVYFDEESNFGHLGDVMNKVIAKTYYNTTVGGFLFSSVLDKKAYETNIIVGSAKWVTDWQKPSIMDGQRTL